EEGRGEHGRAEHRDQQAPVLGRGELRAHVLGVGGVGRLSVHGVSSRLMPIRTIRGSTSLSITNPATKPRMIEEAMLKNQLETGLTGVNSKPGSAPITEVVMPANRASSEVGKMLVEKPAHATATPTRRRA